jgi:hypothetical protein
MYFPLILFVLDRRQVRRRLVQERNLRRIDSSSTESTDSRSVIRHRKRIHDRRIRVQNRPISVSRKNKKRQQQEQRRASGKEEKEDSEKKRQEQDGQRQSSGVEDSVDSEDQPLVVRRKKIRKKHPTGTPTKTGQRKHP